jgi:hypothetical protein
MTKSTKHIETSYAPKPAGKQAAVVALLTRGSGATVDQMIEATGWLPHTTRAALTGLKKRGYEIGSEKTDGIRTYRAKTPTGDSTK